MISITKQKLEHRFTISIHVFNFSPQCVCKHCYLDIIFIRGALKSLTYRCKAFSLCYHRVQIYTHIYRLKVTLRMCRRHGIPMGSQTSHSSRILCAVQSIIYSIVSNSFLIFHALLTSNTFMCVFFKVNYVTFVPIINVT